MKSFTVDKLTAFSVEDTLTCGQVFRYKKLSENVYQVFSRDKYARLTTLPDKVVIETDDVDYFAHYFDFETDYDAKVTEISNYGEIMAKSAESGRGIHILNQDLYEMFISFIISANNNIKRIQLIVERLCDKLGEDTPHGKAFPTPEKLAEQDEKFFESIGAGYRAKYLEQTSKRLVGYDFCRLQNMTTDDARKELLTFLGVGPKVADCILLFGMHRGDVFPVDTWLKKVYHAYFEKGHKDSEISPYFRNLFGENAGLCQQYLFYFQRKYRQNE